MTRLTAKDFPQELLELYDFYAHGRITKREFLDRAARYAVGGVTAAALLASLSPDYALAQQIAFTDPDIVAEYITYTSEKGNGEVRAYLVRPAKIEGKAPGVVVVHENRGLNPYIEDVARRVAKASATAAEYRTQPPSPIPSLPPPYPSTVARRDRRTCRASRRRCSCTTRSTTITSTPAGRPTRRR